MPRRKLGVGGWDSRCAQSRGEWPGSRRTFFGRRALGARVEVEGAREDGGAREREGGARRVEAVEGGGRMGVEGLGGARPVVLFEGGRGGGGMRVVDGGLVVRFPFGVGRIDGVGITDCLFLGSYGYEIRGLSSADGTAFCFGFTACSP